MENQEVTFWIEDNSLNAEINYIYIYMKNKRKQMPVFTGVLRYFPDAIKEVAKVSYAGNQQHHPDKPLHWDRNKSTDELDALSRHLIDAGTFDEDGMRHSAKGGLEGFG